MAYTYDEDTGVYTVPFEDFDALLKELPANTAGTFYKINVTGITQSIATSGSSSIQNGTLKYVLNNNKSKYVYLAEKDSSYNGTISSFSKAFSGLSNFCGIDIIPQTVTDMLWCFSDCTRLDTPVNLPESLLILNYCFYGCWNFNQPITIPSSVKSMESCFNDCGKFNQSITISDSVTTMRACFSGCTSFNQPVTIPNSVTTMEYCFNGCSSFNKPITIPDSVKNLKGSFMKSGIEEITLDFNYDSTRIITGCFNGCSNLKAVYTHKQRVEENSWHYFSIDPAGSFNIYEKDNATPVSGTFTPNGNDYILPIKTDELVIDTTTTMNETDVQAHVLSQLPFAKNALSPSQKNFVLWSDNPNGFKTNLSLGGTIIDDNTQSVDHTYSSNKIESRIADFVSKGTSTNNQGYIKLAEPNFYLVWGTHNIGSQTVNGHTSKGQFSFDAPFSLQGVDVGIASLGGDANVVSGDIYMASSTKFGVYIANTKTDNVTANFNLKYMCIVRKA